MSKPDPTSAIHSIRLAVADRTQAFEDYRLLFGSAVQPVNSSAFQLDNVELFLDELADQDALPNTEAQPNALRSTTIHTSQGIFSIDNAVAETLNATATQHLIRAPETDVEESSRLDGTGSESSAGVHAIDHLVIQSADVDATRALYEQELGLRVLFDREFEKFGMRLCMLRIGDAVLEIAGKLAASASPDPKPSTRDHLWGITWRCHDINAIHQRLSGTDLDLSDVRQGRRPGSRVFTVRSGTQGVPTLLIQHGDA